MASAFGVTVEPDLDRAATRAKEATEDGVNVVRVQLGTVETKQTLLAHLGKAFSLPDYFRPNWDSLHECIRDEFIPQQGVFLVVEHAAALLDLPNNELRAFLSILVDTAQFWKAEGVRFSSMLVGPHELEQSLPI